jgi:hypothetical protein
MNQLETIYNGKVNTFNLPSSLEEMSPDCFLTFIDQLLTQKDDRTFKSIMFTAFLKQAKFNLMKRVLKEYNYEHLATQYTHFLFQEKTEAVFNCLIPNLFGWRKLEGFGLLMSNLSFRQFRKAQCFARDFAESDNIEDLAMMIAWLYLPKYCFSKQAEQTDKTANKRGFRIVKNLKYSTMYAIYTNFNQVRDTLKYKFPLTLGKADEKAKFFGTNGKEINLEDSFEDMLFNRSGGDILKDNLVDLSPALDVFAHFESEARDYKRQKEAIDNA